MKIPDDVQYQAFNAIPETITKRSELLPALLIVADWAFEKAAAYVEGKDGLIPGANAFASLVSGNPQPCMSGDGLDRMHPRTRRMFDDATADLASAIRALKNDVSVR